MDCEYLVGHNKAVDPRRQTADPAMKNNKFVWWGIVWLQTSGVDCRPKRAGLQNRSLRFADLRAGCRTALSSADRPRGWRPV